MRVVSQPEKPATLIVLSQNIFLPLLQAAAPKGLTFNVDMPSPGPVISANANQIQQVLTNLVTNAWEGADEKKGAIDLIVRTVSPVDIPTVHHFPIDWQPQDKVLAYLEVTDTGCGIALRTRILIKFSTPFSQPNSLVGGLVCQLFLGL